MGVVQRMLVGGSSCREETIQSALLGVAGLVSFTPCGERSTVNEPWAEENIVSLTTTIGLYYK